MTKLNPDTPIFKSIQYMDHEAIDILRKPAEKGTVEEWHAYLDRTHVSWPSPFASASIARIPFSFALHRILCLGWDWRKS